MEASGIEAAATLTQPNLQPVNRKPHAESESRLTSAPVA